MPHLMSYLPVLAYSAVGLILKWKYYSMGPCPSSGFAVWHGFCRSAIDSHLAGAIIVIITRPYATCRRAREPQLPDRELGWPVTPFYLPTLPSNTHVVLQLREIVS